MRQLSRKIWSHNSASIDAREFVRDIRLSKPKLIDSYRKLIFEIAVISYKKRHQNLFFRGQDKDYKDLKTGTIIYPTFYRDLGKNKKISLEHRNKLLNLVSDDLNYKFGNNNFEFDSTFKDYPEVKWAICQHYDVCKTPLLDLTSSLRAACSFALNGNRSYGYIFVLGLPHINGSISFYVEEELINIKLLGICPPTAIRPYYQEGYLVGTLPYNKKPP